MVRCPVCEDAQVVYVAGPAATSCLGCGARWIQNVPAGNGVEHADPVLALNEVICAIEDERARLAADLHDGPIQRIAALGMRTYLGLRELRAGDRMAATRTFEGIEAGLDREIRSLRALVTQLRPPVLSELGLVDALRDHASSIASERKIVTTVEGSIDALQNEDVQTGLYRIAQEAMTNAYRHSGASRIDVRVEPTGRAIRLTVQDDGAGFDATRTFGHDGDQHYGLVSMQERAAKLHGSLTVTSAPAGGTTVTAELPVED